MATFPDAGTLLGDATGVDATASAGDVLFAGGGFVRQEGKTHKVFAAGPAVTVELSGQSHGQAAVAASVTKGRLLHGQVSGTATAAADLGRGRRLAGSATGSSTVTTQVRTDFALTGQSTGAATAGGSLTRIPKAAPAPVIRARDRRVDFR